MTLITNIEELKEYNAAANVGIDMSTFTPSCRHIERKMIVPLIGRELFNVLTDAYTASIADTPVDLPEELADLLSEVRPVLAPLAILHYKHTVIAGVSDAGLDEKVLQNREPVRMWVNNLQSDTLFNEAMDAADMLLAFLEENKADYPEWVDSDAFTQYKEFLLQTTKEFDTEVRIGSSRRMFRALRPDIKYAEHQVIRPAIGSAFYNRLLGARKDGSLSSQEQAILDMIFPVVANCAIANSTLPVEVGSDGMYQLYTDSQFSGFKSTKRPLMPEELEGYRRSKTRMYTKYLQDLLEYLNANASSSLFPEYFNSSSYTAPDTDEDDESPNDNLKNIFVA